MMPLLTVGHLWKKMSIQLLKYGSFFSRGLSLIAWVGQLVVNSIMCVKIVVYFIGAADSTILYVFPSKGIHLFCMVRSSLA